MKQPARKFRIERRKLDSGLNRQKRPVDGKVWVAGVMVASNPEIVPGVLPGYPGLLVIDVIRALHSNPRELWGTAIV